MANLSQVVGSIRARYYMGPCTEYALTHADQDTVRVEQRLRHLRDPDYYHAATSYKTTASQL